MQIVWKKLAPMSSSCARCASCASRIVAQTLGISQTHLSNMECGRVKFSLKQLLRLANLFDCQLECFFDPRQAANVAVGGTGQDKRYTQSDMELLLTLVKKSGQP